MKYTRVEGKAWAKPWKQGRNEHPALRDCRGVAWTRWHSTGAERRRGPGADLSPSRAENCIACLLQTAELHGLCAPNRTYGLCALNCLMGKFTTHPSSWANSLAAGRAGWIAGTEDGGRKVIKGARGHKSLSRCSGARGNTWEHWRGTGSGEPGEGMLECYLACLGGALAGGSHCAHFPQRVPAHIQVL